MFARVCAALPGWLFLVSGLAMLGAALVMPSWLSNRQVAWELHLMQAQSTQLDRQVRRYAAFHEALAADDPVVLRRLALVQLRAVPVGQRLLTPSQPDPQATRGLSLVAERSDFKRTHPRGGRAFEDASGAAVSVVDRWLNEPLPEVGRDIAPLSPMNTRLTRLSTGRDRYLLMAAGLLCLLGGCWMGIEKAGNAGN